MVTEDGMELKATRKDHEQNKEMLKKIECRDQYMH
jgi:hypothetical protein